MKFDYMVKLNGVYYPAGTEIVLNKTAEEVKPESKPKNANKKASKK